MDLLLFAILFPFLVALALLVIPKQEVKKAVGYIAAALIIGASIYLLYLNIGSPLGYYAVGWAHVGEAMLAVEALMALYIAYKGIQHRKYLPVALAITQLAILLYLELGMHVGGEVASPLFLDQLSLMMVLIIGVVGGLICVYAFDYMEDFHKHHAEVKDRRGVFFFLLFAFLGAMFGLVLSNSLLWVYFFWEMTTLCSFLLIAYTRSSEAISNAFNALTINLLGGLAFILAIFALAATGTDELTLAGLLAGGKAAMLLPAALIGFAALTKSAQMPFSSWLVGAMVAPTPVSALLHSSTMVKAGVYALVRLAPIYESTAVGGMLSLVGCLTFVLASGIAISQSNAKKVLAYSTIANLGLIVACAGIGSYEAVWAAVLLIGFHALSKALMFLSVGTVEHRIGSRDIEDMEGLIIRMPRTAFMMLVGIAGMFLAPFGMLISKWATLKAFIGANPLLIGMVALGSGFTVFFWSKWMGKLVAVTRLQNIRDERIGLGEWFVLCSLSVLTVCMCLLFPLFSHYLVEPFVARIYGQSALLAQENVVIMILMLSAILLLPATMAYYSGKRKQMAPYMGGRHTSEGRFAGSMGTEREISMRNYYLERMFGEKKLLAWGTLLCTLLVAVMLVASWGTLA